MNPTAAKHFIASLLEMPEFMDKAFEHLTPELLVSKPENDKSPLAEHAWHVRDCESELYGMRIRKVLAEDEPYLEPMTVGHWPEERNYLTKPVKQATQEFRALRESLVKNLQSLSVSELERSCKRADGRTSTVLDLLAELHEHDQDHRKRVVAILALRRAGAA